MSAKIVAIMGIICEVAEMALWIVASFIKLTFAGTTIGGMWVLVEDSLHPKFTYGPAVACGIAIVLYILAFLAEQKQNNTFFLVFLIVMGLRVIGSGASIGLYASAYALISSNFGAYNQATKSDVKTPIFFLILLIAAGIFFLVRAVFYFLIFRAYRAFKSGDREQTQAEMTDGYADNEQMA